MNLKSSNVCGTAEYIFVKVCSPRFGSLHMYIRCTLKHILKLLNIINVKNITYVVAHIYNIVMD